MILLYFYGLFSKQTSQRRISSNFTLQQMCQMIGYKNIELHVLVELPKVETTFCCIVLLAIIKAILVGIKVANFTF